MTPEEIYQEEKKSHDSFIRGYKAAIRDAQRFGENFVGFGVLQHIIGRLESEASMRDSCDALTNQGITEQITTKHET